MKAKYRSVVQLLLFSLFPVSFLGSGNFISKGFLQAFHSVENLGSLFVHYVYQDGDVVNSGIDLSVKSITFYKETNLNTGASSYFTKVVVARSTDTKASVDLRLGLEDGTAIDTSWVGNDSSAYSASRGDSSEGSGWMREFEFKTNSAPEYAQIDPWNKIAGDRNYSDNSLMVDSFFLPVVKWIGRVFAFFQNILLTGGVIA
jgi:hypothetical protein